MKSTSPMLREAKRLYDLGFAILWLHPKSKRPIGNEWTTGPRKKWKELLAQFEEGMNVGVRTGTPSKLDAGYLACIDVDVKDPKYRKVADAALEKLVGRRALCEVASGSGNGSRHMYCVTEEPFKMITVEKHDGWEICVYSDKRQMVLPPSIHPNGNPYVWVYQNKNGFPLMEFDIPEEDVPSGKKRKKILGDPEYDFEFDPSLDIRWMPGVSENIRKLIVKGEWKGSVVTDRSSHLLTAANGLLSAGLSRDEVLTVLTDKTTYLGQTGYDHAQSASRARAARWVDRYTLKGVIDARDPKKVFTPVGEDDAVEENLSPDAAKKQAKEFEEEMDWESELARTKDGAVRNTFNNCKLILTNVAGTHAVVGRNEFAAQDYYLVTVPWRSKKGDAITDIDFARIKEYCAERFGVEFGDDTIVKVLAVIADVNRFHPVRNYLRELNWDGTPRIDTWLKDFAGASGPDEYVEAVSRKMLVALVKRVMEPGCKFDHVLILEGLQGIGKSTLLSNLIGEAWFTDQALNIGDKDSVMTMQSKWLIELGELASMNRSEVEQMKAFITQRTDRMRAPYGRKTEEYPRQSIFVGSTNLDEYLKDETGNRRFWPVKCAGAIDFEGVRKVRDQLFAEALAYYRLGEPLYLETKELNLQARIEQARRGESDEWTNTIVEVLNGEIFPRGGFEMRQLAAELEQFGAHRLEKSDQMRMAKILKMLGYEKFQEMKGARRKLWRKMNVELPGTTSNHLGGSTKTPMKTDFY